MKLGILGSGKIVAEVLEVIKDIEEIELIAISARKEEKLKTICEKYNIPKYYLSIDELLADDNVNVVYVALPNILHYEAMKKIIASGKNIICEKPFTTNIREAEEISQLAESKNIIVIEAITHRFIPNAIKAKEHIKDLGALKIISLNYSQYSSRYDNFRDGIIEPAFDINSAGGALMDLNLYNISFATDTFGDPNKVKYFANIDHDIDTSGLAVLDYGDFVVSAIGSKDTAAPVSNTIQGIDGTMEIADGISTFAKFSIKKIGEENPTAYNFNDQSKSRLYYEFIEFVKIFEARDYQRADELMAKTLLYMDVLTRLRLDAGIVFATDK